MRLKLTRSVNALKGFAQKKNITLVCEPTEFVMKADAARLTQVVVNLLSNGVKFSAQNTEVRVGAFDVGEFMEIRVTDQGPGVPPDQRELVFERFERAGNKRNSKVEGTGLGLAICKSIVDAHSGMIGIRDNPSGGAVFWFRIPKTPAVII
jgi:signal transduction histidine kinase